jgi:exopolysaccharide biosynthesis polyprenyl glycosylphosphotransferase
VARWRRAGLLTPNLVVVGATNHAEDLIATALQRRDMAILGVFDDRAERSPLAMLGVPVLGTTRAMLRHRVMPYVDLVVVAIDPSATTRVRQIMDRLAVLPNTVTMLFDDPTASRRAAAIDHLADAPLAPLRPVDAGRRAMAKRVQDLVIAVPAAVILAPVLALTALAIRVDSPGPIFFRQRRHGFNNEAIVVWKFRTMRHASADARAERQVTADDDRVTRVGRFLRKTSLDELPQLFNVVKGEMSLVGPRPHAIGMKTGEIESDQLVAEYAHRHRIKPGMTGWAAINGSRGPLHEPEDVARRVALDVGYIERQSTLLDLRIIAMTIPTVLGDRDAVR